MQDISSSIDQNAASLTTNIADFCNKIYQEHTRRTL